jgi:ribosomal protein S18 acetylase RimI-like enzyme
MAGSRPETGSLEPALPAYAPDPPDPPDQPDQPHQPDPSVRLRRARTADAGAVARLWWRTRMASVPAVPAPVHDEADVRRWAEDVLVASDGTWVAERGSEIVAMMTVEGTEIDQLYVAPEHQHRELGTMLVELARRLSPHELNLWTVHSNTPAQRFYEALGFEVVDATDGDNEEGAPDLRYRWKPGAGA